MTRTGGLPCSSDSESLRPCYGSAFSVGPCSGLPAWHSDERKAGWPSEAGEKRSQRVARSRPPPCNRRTHARTLRAPLTRQGAVSNGMGGRAARLARRPALICLRSTVSPPPHRYFASLDRFGDGLPWSEPRTRLKRQTNGRREDITGAA